MADDHELKLGEENHGLCVSPNEQLVVGDSQIMELGLKDENHGGDLAQDEIIELGKNVGNDSGNFAESQIMELGQNGDSHCENLAENQSMEELGQNGDSHIGNFSESQIMGLGQNGDIHGENLVENQTMEELGQNGDNHSGSFAENQIMEELGRNGDNHSGNFAENQIMGVGQNGEFAENEIMVLGQNDDDDDNHSENFAENQIMVFGQNIEHVVGTDMGQVGDDDEENGCDNNLLVSIADQQEPKLEGHEMILHHHVENNTGLDLPETSDLAIDSENQELEENMELALVETQYSPEPLYGMELANVLQARTIPESPDFQLHVGQEFSDVKSCRRALRDTAIALHFEIQTIKSDKTRFTAKCAADNCPWRIHAAKLPGVPTFTIRTINDNHTCGGIAHLGHQQASVQWVANSVEQHLRENPLCKPKEILEEIHRTHGITLSYKQAWRGKERIMAAMRGSFEEDYRLLPQYCEQVKRTNPGSIACVFGNPTDNSFQRLFISFQASIYGFLNACRPLIGLDRTPLKSKYLGTLLLATGFDGDGGLFPLAFGVVDEENDDNWMWFLSELHNLLEINAENMPRLTILSDRQTGIVDGVETNFPTAFHGYCMRHLSESFRREFNNTMLVNLLWESAHALTVMEYEAKLLEIEDISQEAAYWIRRVPPRLWATAYFEGTRFGHLTANIVEQLNSWILEASGLPIVQMMECIRRQLMTWFNERRETSMQWSSILVPTAERRVAEALERARTYQVLRANEAEFEVISHEGTNVVDIRNRCCLCRGWQLYGLPCAHAVAALLSCRQNVHRFTESCFTVAMYRKTYSQTIHPIPDKTLWNELSEDSSGDLNGVKGDEIVVNPPKSLRAPGRPRKKRVRAEDHGRMKRVVHCSRCNQSGHFRTTCAAPI